MATQRPAFRPAQFKPLGAGSLDLRSLPENVAAGSFRWVENVAATAAGKLCRRPGYQKLLTEVVGTYNNQDLHSQLFSYTPQPIHTLFEAVSISGVHRLVACTQNRIYALDDSAGNWRVLSDNLGGTPTTTCSQVQWRVAQVEDTVIFTNGSDAPVYWTFDGPALSNNQSVSRLTDLSADNLNVTRADVVFSWRGIMFLANVVADGVRVNHRLMWSDYKRPLSFIPTSGSVAGTHDLGYGEDILAMADMNDSLLIYTTRGIWECQVGDPTAEIFTFRRRYGERHGHACLAYRNTLLNTGTDHIYWGRDGIYAYNLYTPTPVRTDWVHRASSAIFDEVDTSQCNLNFGGWDPDRQEAWYSWTKVGGTCPYRTLVINTQYRFIDIIQQGFTCFGNYRPSDSQSVTDYLTQNCICPTSGLNILDANSPLQGGFCQVEDPPDCNTTFNSLYTQVQDAVAGLPNFIEKTGASADNGSLYHALGNLTIDDLCSGELAADQCQSNRKFIFAAVNDNCIKQVGGQYAWERCVSHAACGTYTNDGYDSILRSGPLDFGAGNNQKLCNRFLVEHTAAVQTVPSSVVPRLGFSRQATDPNLNVCPIMWQTLPAKMLECQSPESEAQHDADRTQPYLDMEWPVYLGGRYLYWEIKVSGTGGESCYSSISMDVTTKPQGI